MDAASFLESGLIDSTGILELVTFLESTYSIRIAEEGEVLPENLDSIERIVVFVRRKIASRDDDRVQGLGHLPCILNFPKGGHPPLPRRRGRVVTPEAVVAHCKARLPSFKVP